MGFLRRQRRLPDCHSRNGESQRKTCANRAIRLLYHVWAAAGMGLAKFLRHKKTRSGRTTAACLGSARYFSTAPWLALVTSRAYRASQPDLTLGSGWT